MGQGNNIASELAEKITSEHANHIDEMPSDVNIIGNDLTVEEIQIEDANLEVQHENSFRFSP